MHRMTLVGVRLEIPTHQPIVLLREVDEPQRVLPIYIGQNEATAIVLALQGTEPPRPMTHDLFKTVLETLDVHLDRIDITDLDQGTFFAQVYMSQSGEQHRISSRPSDAFALAARCDYAVPIYVDDSVLEAAGVQVQDEDEDEQVQEFREFLDHITPDDFMG
ncbi:MAG: bifunctional nuclease family protein [Actinobacteria bacterium]|nr:bifunctional nuclease family protein [Actinomycetota bacterium]MCB9388613.1 bifunctional nuclease family protein [Acidimicrobiia bacterium]